MKKSSKLFFFSFFLLVFTFSFISAEDWGYNYLEGELNVAQAVNYSLINVNNSQYFRSYTPSTLGSWLETTFNWITNAVNDLVNYYTKTQSDARYRTLTNNTFLGNASFDTSTLFIDSVSNRVGIGTTTPQNALNVIGSINQTVGNLTGDFVYGEMWDHNDSGFTVDLITVQVYENVTNLTTGSQNGFILSNSKLTTQISGVYKVDYSVSFSGSANSEIGFDLGINGVFQNNTHSHRKIGTGGDIGNTGGTGYIFLNQGDVVTLMARDEASPVRDISIVSVNINLLRVGN